jgi:hypothetical protein
VRRVAALSAVLVVSLAPMFESRASAGDTGQDVSVALKKLDAGRRLFDQGKFTEALTAFQESYSLYPSPNSRLYLARTYRALGKIASAYTTYRLTAREAQDRLTASGEKRYIATRDAASSEAGELEPKVPRLTIVVPAGTPDDFVIKRDGTDVPKAAWGVAVETDPGSVVVDAAGSRVVPFKQTVTLAEGAQVRVEVTVARVPTATLSLQLKTRPAGMQIALDGAPLDMSAAETRRDVDVGEHSVVVSAPGYAPVRWSKTLSADESAVVPVALVADTHAGGPPKWLFFVVAGAAVGSLATASVIAVNAQDQHNQQVALSPYARDPNVQSSIRSESTVADILFVGGGVLAAGAVALAITTRWRSEAGGPSAWVAPWVAPGAGGIGAHGRF